MLKKAVFLVIIFIIGINSSVYSQSKALVQSANAFLRVSPSKNGKVKFTIKKNTKLEINTKKNKKGWRFVSLNKNKNGWVDTDQIKILVDEPKRKSTWLMIGKSAKTNGFSVRYYLNLSHIVRNDRTVNFWTKMVPSNTKPYLSFLVTGKVRRNPSNFDYNVDLWEGNCSTKKVEIMKSLLHWKNGQVENRKISKSEIKASGNSAAKTILLEACKIGKNL